MPVHEIATLAPMTVEASSPAFDAMLLMARSQHSPCPRGGRTRVLGMITATDLSERNSTSAVYTAGKKFTSRARWMVSSKTAPKSNASSKLAAAGALPTVPGHIVTAITVPSRSGCLTGRVRFGSAPVDYAWVAAGSQARNEQTAKSDQDNCLILDDR